MEETKDLMVGHSTTDVANQMDKIQDLMATVMQEGAHYGVIPGTEKPTLLQPGAQKLCLTFGIGDKDLEMNERELPGGHREYKFHKEFYHRESGKVITEAWGMCSTMESRYRWRKSYEPVGDVPKGYWQIPKDDMTGKEEFLVGLLGPGKYRVRKIEGEWKVVRLGEERIENLDIADTYNTVMAIADKRCYVRGVIKALAASDLFTHDIEDFDQDGGDGMSLGGGRKGGGSKGGSGKAGKGGKGKGGNVAKERKERMAKETERQDFIEKIALSIAGKETTLYFTEKERGVYASEIKGGGPSGGSLPTEDLKKLVEEVEAELAKRKAMPEDKLNAFLQAKVDGNKDLDNAANKAWKKDDDKKAENASEEKESTADDGKADEEGSGGQQNDLEDLQIF